MTTASIWEYFEKLPNKTAAKCMICRKHYSYKTSITNLKKHLVIKHLKAYHTFMSDRANVSTVNKPKKMRVSAEERSSSSPEPVYISDPQPDLSPDSRPATPQEQNTTDNTPSLLDIEYKKQIDKKLLQMIIQDYQPFSIVEDQGFRSFVRALNPNYELPNRKYISGTLIPGQFVECKTQIMEHIQNAKNVCITIESWTSVVMDLYLAVTAHFMLDFKHKTVMLHCEQFSSSHTADDLANSLQNIVQEYDLSEKISLAVSNNDHNIANAIEKNQWPFFGCFVRKLNLIIEEGIEVIDFILEKVKEIVGYFKNDNFAIEALLKYQTDIEKKSLPLRLIQMTATRWNTVFYMLQRFLNLQGALQAVMNNLEEDLPFITKENWVTIKHLCMILQPFEEATRIMSSKQFLTASLAIIIVDGLKNVINVMKSKSIYGVAKTFLEKLEEGLNTYFPEKEIEDNILLGVCTFIDPRFKIHAFLDNTEVDETPSEETCERSRRAHLVKKHVVELIKNKIREKQQMMANSIEIDPIAPNTSIEVEEESEQMSIWGKIHKNIAARTPTSDDVSSKAKNELEMFLNEEVLRRDSCPYDWWKSHALVYPNLADIFREYSLIVVTSVQSERVFSKTGDILNERRARLSRKHTTELVFLNGNSSFSNYE